MAYNETLADRIRNLMRELPSFTEKKMFGGIGFMLQGNMACGIQKDEIIVRVGPDKYQETLTKPHAKSFDFTGKPMKGWVMIEAEGCQTDETLKSWVQLGVDFALSLPAK